MRLLTCLAALAASPALAETFQRPIPEVQTAEAELSYLIAAITMLVALVAVQWLVRRR